MDTDNKLDTSMLDFEEQRKITPPQGRTIIIPKISEYETKDKEEPATINPTKVKAKDDEI